MMDLIAIYCYIN